METAVYRNSVEPGVVERRDVFTEIDIPENMIKITDMHLELTEAERKFRRACEQIVALNHQMDRMTGRYGRAKEENRRSFRYTLRLKLAVVEGVRNVYYDYAQIQAVKINKLRRELYGEENDESDDSGDDSDDDSDIPELE